MKQIGFWIVLLLSFNVSGQTNWYVDYQNGNNANDGTSHLSPVKTVAYLTQNVLIQPGDTVWIMGEYHNPSYDPQFSYGGNNDRNNPHIWHAENTIKLNRLNGRPNRYISFKPYDSTTVLKGDGANIFRIVNCSYLRIEGFEIYGESEHIPLSVAEGLNTDGLQFLYLDPQTADPHHPALSEVLFRVSVGTSVQDIENTTYPVLGNVTRPSYTDTRGLYVSGSHHIEISRNLIHHMPGGGLRVSESSYITITGNEIHHCTGRSYSGTHALVVTKALPGTADSTDRGVYSIKIQRNLIHHNYNEIFSWAPTKNFIHPRIDEGKGISLQRNNLTDWQNGDKRILAVNNLCYWNGFSGLHSNDGYHIDFVNNTCYMNSYTNTVTYANDTQQGNNIGISTSDGGDIKIINNISVVDTDWGGFAISSNGNTLNLVVRNNLIYGTNGTVTEDPDVAATSTIIDDPGFADAASFDFRLQPNSPAIGAADPDFSPVNDYFDHPRDSLPDLGAIEYVRPMGTTLQQTEDIKVIPNPFAGKLIVDHPLRPGDWHIYDSRGKDVTQEASATYHDRFTEIHTSRLPAGIYLLKIQSLDFVFYKLLIRK